MYLPASAPIKPMKPPSKALIIAASTCTCLPPPLLSLSFRPPIKAGIKGVVGSGSVKYLPSTGPPVGETCEHCSFKHQIGGPIWNKPIKSDPFVTAVKVLFTLVSSLVLRLA